MVLTPRPLLERHYEKFLNKDPARVHAPAAKQSTHKTGDVHGS